METEEFEGDPEVEVVETSYMCGECYLLFPTTEDFAVHQCTVAEVKVEDVTTEAAQQPTTSSLDDSTSITLAAGTWEAGESEAAMEEAVASILGERMKRTAPQEHTVCEAQLEHSLEEGELVGMPNMKEVQVTPLMDHSAEDSQHMEGSVQVEAIEIPTTNLYMYDNPAYLNRLMKDNTFGRRVRHDAPYSQRLGPWDNRSSRFLIQLLGEYPRAYFILDKECKRTEAWEIIRLRLAEAGCQFTVLQIRMRWRELCKKYRNTVNHNDMYNTRKTCQFFDELNDLFGVWDHPATLLLIRQFEVYGGKPLGQNGGTRMRIKVWDHIRQELLAHGYKYTADQVQGRWSNLVTLYQRMVEHNSKPHNEPITIAFKEHIERVFNYVPERNSKWLKILEKRGKTPKTVAKKWTMPVERKLVTCYQERVHRFNNDYIDNNTLWKEIVEKLEEEEGFSSTPEKVRAHFYDLTKQFSMTEQHNAQPGTIRRESRHYEMLSEIYNTYNFWPHDRSTIKMEKTNTMRMRQVNAQLSWSEGQSRALLQLYPQILVSHVTSGEHQPMEELWLQLAKAYMNATMDRKHCYEIEEHIAILRQGYHSQNPFPFVGEMHLLEETESTLGFVVDAPPAGSDHWVSYWSHRAAHLLMDMVIHHRQEGVKNSGLFEAISRDLAEYEYRYTGEECRVYYSLLRQLYTNRLRSIKRKKELNKPFPYMDKMAEVDAVVSQPKFVETPENCQVVVVAASAMVKELSAEEGEAQREQVFAWLENLRLFLKRTEAIHPLPTVKCLAQVLMDAMEDSSSDDKDLEKCRAVLSPHDHHLKSIAGKGVSGIESKIRKTPSKSGAQPKYGCIQWTEENLVTMLRIIKEWKLLCHSGAEGEVLVGSGQPVWGEVAFSVGNHYKVDPNKCYERFTQLCREYKSVLTFNARLGEDEKSKSATCQDLMDEILSLHVSHDARLDSRDIWWASEATRSWGQDETLDLIFCVREVWTEISKVNWDVVSKLMAASGYKHSAENCQERFLFVYKSYQLALEHNKHCNMKTRRRPPFYFKMYDLFGGCGPDATLVTEADQNEEISLDKDEVLPILVAKLKKVKGHQCHSVPRRPLLLLLAQHLNQHFHCTPPVFDSCNVWKLLVHLHQVHYEAAEQNTQVQDDINLGTLWHKNPTPVIAYGLHALNIPGWEKACSWSVDEVSILMKAVVDLKLQQLDIEGNIEPVEIVARKSLKSQGYERSVKECQDQWLYIVSVFSRGGYEQFKDQLNLINILAPSLLASRLTIPQASVATVNISKQQQVNSQPQKVLASPSPEKKDVTLMHASKKRKLENNESVVVITTDDIDGGGEISASENVASFVKICVTNNNTQITYHDDICVNELENGETLDFHHTERNQSASSTQKDVQAVASSAEISSCVSKRKTKEEKHNNAKVSCSPADVKCAKSEPVEKTSLTKSSKDKVQVEVISIKEKGSGKLIECQTLAGSTPMRTLKLHYPATHALPQGVRYLYIPEAMVHPHAHTGRQSATLPSSTPPQNSHKSEECSIASAGKVLCKSNTQQAVACKGGKKPKDTQTIIESSVYPGTNISEEKEAILELVSEYTKHCQQANQRLHNIIEKSHHHHISALKKVLIVFQNIEESV